MATSAFKSTTKRTPISQSSSVAEDSSSSSRSSAQRRSRSLSRFSRPLRLGEEFDDVPAPRGRFVNTVRGSGFPEISLDDLAVQFFDASSSNSDRGRSVLRKDDVNPREGRLSSASLRRGRSVSRQSSRVSGVVGGGGRRESLGPLGNSHIGRREDLESNSRRKRSVSVVRYQNSDSESDLNHSQNLSGYSKPRNNHVPGSRMQTPSNHRQVLRRSISQKDLTLHDDYSSQSSALTDDEGRDTHSYRNGIERTIRTVYAQKAEHPIAGDVNGGLYEVMRKELRHAVEEIKMELEQTRSSKRASDFVGDCHLQPKNTTVRKAVSSIRRNTTELDKSKNRRQDVSAKIVLEERCGRKLSMIAKDMLPQKKDDAEKKPLRTRKSNAQNRMSELLDEEAEKYIEDFISNIEDTDISSLDGERSETSSTFGGISKTESFQTPPISKSNLVEIDGVVLPWLQWETTNDASPLSCNKSLVMQSCNLWSFVQEAIPVADLISSHSTSSHGNWSPGVHYGLANTGDSSIKSQESGIYPNQFSSSRAKRLSYDVEEYPYHQSDDEFLYERLKQQQRIHSGGLMLCNRMFF